MTSHASTEDALSVFAIDLLKMIETDISTDPTHVVDVDTDLLLTGLVDSLGVVMIVGWLEDRLGIAIDPSDVILENFQTVGQILSYVEKTR